MDTNFFFKEIKFYNLKFNFILKILQSGGYLVAPAASALVDISDNKVYYKALKKSKIAILDSGFFCLLIRNFYKKKIKKFSGFLFFKKLVNSPLLKNKKFLLINPSAIDEKKNKIFLNKKNIRQNYHYKAPIYKMTNIRDVVLIEKIKKVKPNFILINIGGGKQEVLAEYISFYFPKLPIICTGAAIGFFTKSQAPINDFIDKNYLGWLIRIIYNPKNHLSRFLKSFKLFFFFKNLKKT